MPVVNGSDVARRRVIVSGRVQGVWFRESCRREAESRGVAGWVRNLPNRKVEAAFEGPSAAVAALVEWCRVGPPRANVVRLDEIVELPTGATRFEVR
jgi:acylphosphatase